MSPQVRVHHYTDASTVFISEHRQIIFHAVDHRATITWLNNSRKFYDEDEASSISSDIPPEAQTGPFAPPTHPTP